MDLCSRITSNTRAWGNVTASLSAISLAPIPPQNRLPESDSELMTGTIPGAKPCCRLNCWYTDLVLSGSNAKQPGSINSGYTSNGPILSKKPFAWRKKLCWSHVDNALGNPMWINGAFSSGMLFTIIFYWYRYLPPSLVIACICLSRLTHLITVNDTHKLLAIRMTMRWPRLSLGCSRPRRYMLVARRNPSAR